MVYVRDDPSICAPYKFAEREFVEEVYMFVYVDLSQTHGPSFMSIRYRIWHSS